MLAAGEGSGPGRMPEPEDDLRARRAPARTAAIGSRGKRVLVTAGPTREAIDPVRFISNHSSGKMGVALAAAAWRRGADVDARRRTAERRRRRRRRPCTSVESTDEMAAAVERLAAASRRARHGGGAGGLSSGERRRTRRSRRATSPAPIALAPTPDILARRRGKRAARTRSSSASRSRRTTCSRNGREKLAAKDLDLIVVNDATEPGAGFGVDTNRVTLLIARRRRRAPSADAEDRSGRRHSRSRGERCIDGR